MNLSWFPLCRKSTRQRDIDAAVATAVEQESARWHEHVRLLRRECEELLGFLEDEEMESKYWKRVVGDRDRTIRLSRELQSGAA